MAPEEEKKDVQEKPKSKKLLIILVLLVVLLGGGGAGAYFKFFRAPNPDAGKEEKKEAEAPVYYEMDTFMVNLADQGGKRFLKANIKLKVNSDKVAEECKLHSFELRDLVLLLLTSKESGDINNTEDKLALKKQIMESVNRALKKGQAVDVYFTEFLVQ